MGSFGYICPKCGKNVRAGELCVLRNVLHGEVIGETIGHYDEYGGVHEDETFDVGTGGKLCFNYEDSSYKVEVSRIHNGKLIEFFWYHAEKWDKYFEQSLEVARKLKAGEAVEEIPRMSSNDEVLAEFKTLPVPDWSLAKSGVSAYHKYCFDRLSDEEKAKCIPSRTDPDQSWGRPRKKYM